jgi:hypothetical protein
MREFQEEKLTKKQSKSWTKIWHGGSRGFRFGINFEMILQQVGQRLDDGQLELVDDWSYVQIELRQYNDLVIDVDIKCKTHKYNDHPLPDRKEVCDGAI